MWPEYAFRVPDQKKLRYIVHFDMGKHVRYPEHQTAAASLEEVERILDLMGLILGNKHGFWNSAAGDTLGVHCSEPWSLLAL